MYKKNPAAYTTVSTLFTALYAMYSKAHLLVGVL